MEEIKTSLRRESRKDKFHLLRVPKGFDIEKLNGVEFNPHEVLRIEAEKDKNGLVNVFELQGFDQQIGDLKLLVNSGETTTADASISQNLCVTKTVQFDSTEQQPSIRDRLKNLMPGPVTLPEGLKPRFTPFGSGSPVALKKKVKKKKSKRKRSRDGSSDESSAPQKRHKRDHPVSDLHNLASSSVSHSSSVSDSGVSFLATPLSVKKIKKEKGIDVGDSFVAMPSSEKKKKSKKEKHSDSGVSFMATPSPKSVKNIKKEKHNSDDPVTCSPNVSSERLHGHDELDASGDKSVFKCSSVSDYGDSLMATPSTETVTKHKKKKHKSKDRSISLSNGYS